MVEGRIAVAGAVKFVILFSVRVCQYVYVFSSQEGACGLEE